MKRRCKSESDVRLHDDGCAFMCMSCGTVTRRTRDNPYPTIRHVALGELPTASKGRK